MKTHCKGWILFVLLALPSLGVSATPIQEGALVDPWLKPLLHEGSSEIPDQLRAELAGRQGSLSIQGREALDLEIRTSATRQDLESLGIVVRTLIEDRATVTVPPERLGALAQHPKVWRISLPRPVQQLLESSTVVSGVEALRSESGGVYSGATGDGVVVGVVDSGIDWDHPNFVDSAGNFRIIHLWDQTSTSLSGSTPLPWGYGREWNQTNLSTSTETDTVSSAGHGTHVTGIAAGNGAAPDPSGATHVLDGFAPDAKIIFVKASLSSSAQLSDAIAYIFDRAQALNLPAVINLSLGSHMGAHDGTDPVEADIDALTGGIQGRAVVVAAGNERGNEIHASLTARTATSVVGPDFVIDPYAASAGRFNDVVRIVGYYPATDDLILHLWSPSGATVTVPLDTDPTDDGCVSRTSGSDGAIEICHNETSNLNQGTADREIRITLFDERSFRPPAAGTWRLALTGVTVAGPGQVDFWMFSSLGGSTRAARFVSHVTHKGTIGIPATSREAIAVGAYSAVRCWASEDGGTYEWTAESVGEVASFSSAGPTRDGREKPELAAPGAGVTSTMAAEVASAVRGSGAAPLVVNDHYLQNQGTSMAAPAVAGAVALLLEEDGTRTPDALKRLLKRHARRDAGVRAHDETFWVGGPFVAYLTRRNDSFGAGKLDLGGWGFDDPYESNEDSFSAFRALSGRTYNGRIEHSDDVDFFRVDGLEAGDTLDVELTSLPADYRLELHRDRSTACGPYTTRRRVSDAGGTADEAASITATASDLPDLIRVTSSAGAYDPSATYSLRAILTRPETSAPHWLPWTAQPLPEAREMNVTGSSSFTTSSDYYSFPVEGSTTITLSTGAGWTVEIRDGSGALLASGTGSVSHRVFGAGGLFGPRTYLAVVTGGTGSYTLNVRVP